MSKHLPWRDEYQTFLVSTRTQTWSEFWEATRYERTPPFHYLIQRALWPLFEGWMEPRFFIRLVTVPFSILIFWLLFFRFRFEAMVAFLLAGSIFFFREWGVISRSYVMGGALLLLSLDFRNREKITTSRVLIALSASVHFLFYLIAAGVLAFDYFSDFRRKGFRNRSLSFWATFTGIGIVAGMVTTHQFITPPGAMFTANVEWPGVLKIISGFFREVAVLLFPVEMFNDGGTWVWEWSWNQSPIRFAFGLLFLVPVIFYFRKSRELGLKLFFISLPVFALFLCVYGPALRHLGVLFVLLVYYMAQVDSKKRSRPASYAISVGPFLASIFWLIAWNPISPRFVFSDATRLVPFFKSTEGVVYTNKNYLTFAAMAESGRDVFDLEQGSVSRYPYFRQRTHQRTFSEACSGPSAISFKSGDLLVLALNDYPSANRLEKGCGNWKMVYETAVGVATDERFKVFRFLGEGPK